ncbi:MAG: tyrosine-type recombinase/integrase [Acetobacteraceae bacterium]
MSLTHCTLLNAQPREKTYKLFDGHGLYLQVAPTGGKWWRVKYRLGGREQCLSLGTFPAVALKVARQRCAELRAQLAAGVDPSAERRLAKQRPARRDDSFEAIAREWYATFSRNWTPTHGDRVLRRLETYVFPWIGKMPIREITAMSVLECLRRLEQQNTHETARRVLRYCSQTLRYAIITGRAETDVLSQLRGALAPRKVQHLASIKDPKQVGALLRAIDGYDGRLVTKFALQFAPLVFVRPGELRRAAWRDFDFLQREWRIPADQMKARQPHIVPLSSQAMVLLRELQPLTGETRFLFPGERSADRPMSNNTLNAGLRRLGYGPGDMTAHGFRSMASTLLNELGWSSDAIERQLAHGERDGVRAVYNYAQYLPERRQMMQGWSDYLDHLRSKNYCCCALSEAVPVGCPHSEQDPRVTWLGPRRITPTWADGRGFLPGAVELGQRVQTDPIDDL